MIKYAAILFTMFILVQSQRPYYAKNNRTYPGVLVQYLNNQDSTPVSGTEALGSRLDSNSSSLPGLESAVTSTPMTTTSTIPPDLPVDALGDVNLINRIKTWPREKQPFWYINWQQIQEHRGSTRNRSEPNPTETRSFFAG
ncbi:PREDICTED: uncharacterized protein LOC108550544 [Eufriesea mexicana]|uniref:uncharacterized protein LOC108550544 n=1 Tax=Eufriesea mexicana TaxID=516756 RepID=UPI00083BEC18|nr:PREDICTED: uncharacterized protein LOC108550544 [Eufriesea mexicana]